jgi:hypothetical protein
MKEKLQLSIVEQSILILSLHGGGGLGQRRRKCNWKVSLPSKYTIKWIPWKEIACVLGTFSD